MNADVKMSGCWCALFVVAQTFVLAAQTARAGDAEPAITLSNHAQMFLDDRLIAQETNLTRTVHQPQMNKNNPVLTYDRPWEYACVTLWGTVLYDEEEKIFKMWYQTWGRTNPPHPEPNYTAMCYATSKDGIKWDKPELGLIEFQDSKANNIVLEPYGVWLDSATVVKDMEDPDPSRRYKMAICESGPNYPPYMGIWTLTSPDGLRWTRMDGPAVRSFDRNSLFRDRLRNKWVVLTRYPGIETRTIAFAESEEFGVFPPNMRMIFEPDDLDPPNSDLYSMPVFEYEGMLIGCPEVYDHTTLRCVTQLAWSYDGDHWMRDPDRQPFMAWGEEPAWDWARRHPHNGPIFKRDGKLWLYFGGRSTLKNSDNPLRIVGAVGLSFLRIDGFVSRDAGGDTGVLVTRPLVLTAKELAVNANIKSNGYMKISVLDADHQPIAELSGSNSVTLRGDKTDHPVQWRQKDGEAVLTSQPVRLRFEYRNAELYSFRVK
jgi:hypothetical protein